MLVLGRETFFSATRIDRAIIVYKVCEQNSLCNFQHKIILKEECFVPGLINYVS